MMSLPPRAQHSVNESYDSPDGRAEREMSNHLDYEEEPGQHSRSRSRSRSRSISKQRNRSRSRSRSPDNDLDEGSANYHIPKRNEFAMAESIVPPPPKRSKPEKRVRVALDDEHKEEQEAWLKGIYLTSQDKQVLLNQIPLPATVLALPSSLDDDLKALLGPDHFSGRTIQVSEKELYSLNELAVNAVNMLGFIKKLSASADSGTHLADDALGYLHTTGDILSVAIKDLIGMRRQLALGALGLKVQDVPSIKRLPLEGSARLDPKLDEYLPNLFGSVLKEELLAADSAVKKAVDRLKARNKPSPSKFVNKDKKAQSTDRRITASTSSRSYNNRPRISGNRCLRSEMVSDLKLRISSVQSNRKGSSKSSQRAMRAHSGHSMLEKPTLVSASCGRSLASSSSNSAKSDASDRCRRSISPASESEKLPPTSLEDLCLSWQREGLSVEAADTLLAGWAPATIKQYNSALRSWFSYKRKNNIQDLPHVQSILNYLASLFTEGKSTSTISSHKAAICAYYDHFMGAQFKAHPLLARFLKGAFRRRPQQPRYTSTWDVSWVLQMLGNWGCNEDLNSSRLVRKLTFLLAICSPRRVSEIANFSLRDMSKQSDSYTFFINYRNKNRSSGPPHSAFYSRFNDIRLCPVACLDHFLIRSEEWRSSDFLLLSPVTRSSVSSATISRWIKEIILEAGVDASFKAHSTRSAATTLAFSAGVSAAEIIKSACWS